MKLDGHWEPPGNTSINPPIPCSTTKTAWELEWWSLAPIPYSLLLTPIINGSLEVFTADNHFLAQTACSGKPY
jgi:hypothetical protein